MIAKELKAALLNERPVIAKIKNVGEIRYDFVYEVVYKKSKYLDKGRISCSAGLMDKNRNSVTYVGASQIRYADEGEKNTADAANTDCKL